MKKELNKKEINKHLSSDLRFMEIIFCQKKFYQKL